MEKLKFTPVSENSDKNKIIIIDKKYIDVSEKNWRIKVSDTTLDCFPELLKIFFYSDEIWILK